MSQQTTFGIVDCRRGMRAIGTPTTLGITEPATGLKFHLIIELLGGETTLLLILKKEAERLIEERDPVHD